MQYYVIVENGEVYPNIYTTYKMCVDAVKEKHREHIEEHIKQCRLEDIEAILGDINVPENPSGKTNLYIEKGINIEIHKLSILQ